MTWPTRVAVGDAYPHLRYLLGLLERGVYIMFDNCGQYRGTGRFEGRILDLILELIDRGFEDWLMLSHDVCKLGQLRIHGGTGFVYLSEAFLPALSGRGVPEGIIRIITHDNPRRWLTGT